VQITLMLCLHARAAFLVLVRGVVLPTYYRCMNGCGNMSPPRPQAASSKQTTDRGSTAVRSAAGGAARASQSQPRTNPEQRFDPGGSLRPTLHQMHQAE